MKRLVLIESKRNSFRIVIQFAVAIVGAGIAHAQVSNYEVSNPSVRVFRGMEYSKDSPAWHTILGELQTLHEDGIIVRQVTYEDRRVEGTVSKVVAPGVTETRPLFERYRVVGDEIFLRNCTLADAVDTGQELEFRAMPAGNVVIDGQSMAAYDCGVPQKASVVITVREGQPRPPMLEPEIRPIKKPVIIRDWPSEEEVVLENLGPVGRKHYLAGRKFARWPTFVPDAKPARTLAEFEENYSSAKKRAFWR